MHLNYIPVSLLVAVVSLCSSSTALPFLWKRAPATEAVATTARHTYSIVPINGGGVTQTVTVTAKPTTIIESLPPVTETVTVSGKPVTRTISIIDIEPTTKIVTKTLTATPAPTSHTITSLPTTIPTSSIPTSNIPTSSIPTSSIPTLSTPSMTLEPSTSLTTTSVYYPTWTGSSNVTITPTLTTSIPVTTWATSSTSSDSGPWYTMYPGWNDTTNHGYAKRSAPKIH